MGGGERKKKKFCPLSGDKGKNERFPNIPENRLRKTQLRFCFFRLYLGFRVERGDRGVRSSHLSHNASQGWLYDLHTTTTTPPTPEVRRSHVRAVEIFSVFNLVFRSNVTPVLVLMASGGSSGQLLSKAQNLQTGIQGLWGSSGRGVFGRCHGDEAFLSGR